MLNIIEHLSWLTYAEIAVGIGIAYFGIYAIIAAFGLIPAKTPPAADKHSDYDESWYMGKPDDEGKCDNPYCEICYPTHP